MMISRIEFIVLFSVVTILSAAEESTFDAKTCFKSLTFFKNFPVKIIRKNPEPPFFTNSVQIGDTDCSVKIYSSVHDPSLKIPKEPYVASRENYMEDYASVVLFLNDDDVLVDVKTWFNHKKICSVILLEIKVNDEKHLAFLIYALLELFAVTGVTKSSKGFNYLETTISKRLDNFELEQSRKKFIDNIKELGFFLTFKEKDLNFFTIHKTFPSETRVYFQWTKEFITDFFVLEFLESYQEGSKIWKKEKNFQDLIKSFEMCCIS